VCSSLFRGVAGVVLRQESILFILLQSQTIQEINYTLKKESLFSFFVSEIPGQRIYYSSNSRIITYPSANVVTYHTPLLHSRTENGGDCVSSAGSWLSSALHEVSLSKESVAEG
jgi:hypothetical protein